MKINKIYNEDCFITIEGLEAKSIDAVITSPPYNTSRVSNSERARKENEARYR